MGLKSLAYMTYVIDTTQGFIVNAGKRIKIQYEPSKQYYKAGWFRYTVVSAFDRKSFTKIH